MDSELRVPQRTSTVNTPKSVHDYAIAYIKVGASVLALLGTTAVILYKIAASNLTFSATALDTTDILSIVLAVFSVGLSVLFYFKSSDDSSKFYNNSYQLTKEMSELLGRIEAGFGERLRHIDEGYSNIGKRIDDVLSLKAQAKEKLAEDEEEVKSASEDRDEIIASLIERADFSEEEKLKIKKQLEEKEKELSYAREQVLIHQNRLHNLERHILSIEIEDKKIDLDPSLERQFRIAGEIIGIKHLQRAPASWLNRRFKEKSGNLPSDFFDVLMGRGFIDEAGDLTRLGRKTLREWANVNFANSGN